jgi:uncharacterized protein
VLITLQELELHRMVISKTYAAGEFDFQGAEFRQVGPLDVEAVAELAGSEIRIRGNLRTRLERACDRCLCGVEIPVTRDFDLQYRPMSSIAREEEVEIPADELDVGFFSGDGVALADVVAEQVILSVPMKVVCRPDCRGLCPVCGLDLNRGDCQCPPVRPDSPFASLLED